MQFGVLGWLILTCPPSIILPNFNFSTIYIRICNHPQSGYPVNAILVYSYGIIEGIGKYVVDYRWRGVNAFSGALCVELVIVYHYVD